MLQCVVWPIEHSNICSVLDSMCFTQFSVVIISWMFHFRSRSRTKKNLFACLRVCVCGSLEQHSLIRIVLYFVHLRNMCWHHFSIVSIAFTSREKKNHCYGEQRSSTTKSKLRQQFVILFFFLSLFTSLSCVCAYAVCIMFIHSHVSDDYLLKELTIPCNLPSQSTFVHRIQLYTARARKQNRVQIKYISRWKEERNGQKKEEEENWVWQERARTELLL